MSALHAIQRDFQDYVLGGTVGEPAIAAAVASQFGAPVSERLAIYYNAYRSRMREALGEAFEKTWSYVGDDMFAELAAGYTGAHPSTHRNLRWYGDRFAQYAAHALPDYPFVAELAGFEWALGTAFDAADATVVTVSGLRHVAPEDWGALAFALHPSAQLLEMDWNTVALWQALNDGQTPPDAQQSAATWLVWRMEGQPHFRSLDVLEADALLRVAQGMPFADVCAALAQTCADGDLTLRVAGFLQNWLAQGLLGLPQAPSPA